MAGSVIYFQPLGYLEAREMIYLVELLTNTGFSLDLLSFLLWKYMQWVIGKEQVQSWLCFWYSVGLLEGVLMEEWD